MATAAEYRRLLVAARKRQLRLTSQQVGRLLDVYTNAANSLADQLTNVPESWLTGGGAIEQGYLRILLAQMNKTILATAQDYQSELNGAMLTLAQDAANREQRIEQLSGVTAARDPRLAASMATTVHLTSGATLNVAFGEVAQTAVQGVAQRYYSDGLKLSDRLYQLTTETQKVVEDTIIQGIAEQVSARELADRLKGQLAAAGSENPTFHAMRIARTEINTAHREAHIRSALGPSGVMKPYIQGVRWNLSQSHPVPDICDVWAGADVDGLGPGLYLPSSVPSDHPHGLCVPAGTVVTSPFLRGATAQRYRGEVIDIETRCGHLLTVTPNHSILTPEGWIKARALRQGCYVISSRLGQRIADMVNPDDYQCPARIEDVVSTLRRAPGMTTRTMPAASVYLHGERSNGQIEVIRADRLLRDAVYPSVSHPPLKEHLGRRNSQSASFTGTRNLLLMGECAGSAAHGGVRSSGHGSALLGRQLRQREPDRRPGRSDGDATLLEQFGDWQPSAVQAQCEALDALAGLVTADQVIRVSKHEFSGHVYNLHTSTGWYIATSSIPGMDCASGRGIIIHNCYTTSELKAFPGVGMGSEPSLDAVPRSQVDYYARQGDAAAGWAQSQGIGVEAAGEAVPA